MEVKIDSKKILFVLIAIAVGISILFADLMYSQRDGEALISKSGIKEFTNWEKGLVLIDNEDTLVATNVLPKDIKPNTSILFRFSHQRAKVYIGETLRHSFGYDEKNLFAKTPTLSYAIINLSDEDENKPIKVELLGSYDNYKETFRETYIGEESAIYHSIFFSKAGSIAICIALMIMGLAIWVIATVLWKNQISKSLLFLGALSITVGVWSLCTSNTLQFIIDDVFFIFNLEFFTFSLLPALILMFFLTFDRFKKDKITIIIFYIASSWAIIVHLLQLLNVYDYMESIIVTHLIILAIAINITYLWIKDFVKKQLTQEVKTLILSIIVLTVFVLIDLFRFYNVTPSDDGFYTRIGMIIFILVWCVEIIQTMSKVLIKITQTKLLETLAYEDQMTGLKNRSAFEEMLCKYRFGDIKKDSYIITFDINNLKQINDILGHSKGDECIVAVCKEIKAIFSNIGDIYRIGGDEICVILDPEKIYTLDKSYNINDNKIIDNKIINNLIFISEDIIKTMLEDFEATISKKGELKGFEINVASGFSKIEIGKESNIDIAYRTADRRMYERKRMMKVKF